MNTLRNQLNRIKQRIVTKVDDALSREVAEAVEQEESQTIREVVYGTYTPKLYRRRGDIDGLADPYNIESSVKSGTLTVRNMTEPNPSGAMDNSRVTTGKYLDRLIEYGHGSSGGFYDFPKAGADFMKARPFTAKTIEHLRENKAHVDALQDGLKRQGIKTKKKG